MSVEATPKASADARGRRLESSKEIAAYLGRDVTTVRRWEKGEGLPVHTEQTFVWLERAAEERSNIMQFLKVHTFFDSLPGDPRFAAYLRRANFPP